MCYVTVVFAPVVALLAVSHTMRICFCVSLIGDWCVNVRRRSWSVLEVLLLRHDVHTMLAVCRVGLAVVFLGVHDCDVFGIALAVGVGPRPIVLLLLFLVV